MIEKREQPKAVSTPSTERSTESLQRVFSYSIQILAENRLKKIAKLIINCIYLGVES